MEQDELTLSYNRIGKRCIAPLLSSSPIFVVMIMIVVMIVIVVMIMVVIVSCLWEKSSFFVSFIID